MHRPQGAGHSSSSACNGDNLIQRRSFFLKPKPPRLKSTLARAKNIHARAENIHVFGKNIHARAKNIHVIGKNMDARAENIHVFGKNIHARAENIHAIGKNIDVFVVRAPMRGPSEGKIPRRWALFSLAWFRLVL
jgi:hypothetical protein